MPKYCDHGAYIPDASITASFSSSTMTVTATTNPIVLGMRILGAGMPDNTFVSSFGTGTGGTGTYNLNTVPGTLGSRTLTGTSGVFNLIPPTFGVPQDGDGVGINPSTASATVNIDLTGATAAAGATISVAGAVLTCVASGATVAQFNAGSGATLAANIAAAINRTTNSATIATGITGWPTTVPIPAACYARVVGNVLQIMFRAGSASHNGLQVVTAGFTGGTFGPYSFSGGVSGCWGLLLNTSVAVLGGFGNYGMWGSLGPLAGAFEAGDIVYIRSNNKVLPTSSSQYAAVSSYSGSTTAQAPVRFVFDTNKIWTGDDPNGHFYFNSLTGSASSFGYRGSYATIESKKFSDTDYGFTVTQFSTGGIAAADFSNGVFVDGIALKVASGLTGGSVQLAPATTAAAGRRCGVANFYINTLRVAFPLITVSGSVTGLQVELGPGVIDATGIAGAHTGVLNAASGATGYEFFLRNVKFVGFVTGSRLFTTSAPPASLRVTFIDCDFGNISQRGPYLGAATMAELNGYITSFTNKGGRDFSYDTNRGFAQWNSVYAQPVLNATLDDGVTKWSMLVAPTSVANACAPYFPFSAPRFSVINALPAGQRTFTVEVAISDQLAWTARDVSVTVAYTAADGSDVVLTTFDPNAGALVASTATWSNESGGKVVYVDGGTLLHNKFKLQLTTPSGKDLPAGAEVTAMVRVHTTVGNTSQYMFVDPEIQVA